MSIPKEGWRWVSTTDLKEVRAHCELCGTLIRYVHKLEHKGENLVLLIGCECASNIMTGADLDYIKDKDREIKNAANREKAEAERLRKCFEARNEFNLKHGIQPLTWEGYLLLVEATQKKNKESAEKKEAQEKRRRK